MDGPWDQPLVCRRVFPSLDLERTRNLPRTSPEPAWKPPGSCPAPDDPRCGVFTGELSEASAIYELGLRKVPAHPGLKKEEEKVVKFPAAPDSSNAIAAARRADLGNEFAAVQLPAGSYRSVQYDFQAGAEVFGEAPRTYELR